MDLVAHGRLGAFTKLNFLNGKGDKYRSITTRERVSVIGREKCQGLIGFHNFKGADWGGKFVGISKKGWTTSYLSLPNSLAKGYSQAMSWWTVSCPKKCGPSRSLFDQYTDTGVQLPYQLCVGNCSGPGIWRARSLQSNIDASYLTHQHCGNEGQKLYNTSPMPTASRGKWMDACLGRVCPSPVSLQTNISCRLGTDQM